MKSRFNGQESRTNGYEKQIQRTQEAGVTIQKGRCNGCEDRKH